jgi:hypothetical protein
MHAFLSVFVGCWVKRKVCSFWQFMSCSCRLVVGMEFGVCQKDLDGFERPIIYRRNISTLCPNFINNTQKDKIDCQSQFKPTGCLCLR